MPTIYTSVQPDIARMVIYREACKHFVVRVEDVQIAQICQIAGSREE